MATHDPALPSFQTMLPAPASATSSITAATSLNSPTMEQSTYSNSIHYQQQQPHPQHQRPDRPSISPVSPDTAGSAYDAHSPHSAYRVDVRTRYAGALPSPGGVSSGGNFPPHNRHMLRQSMEQSQNGFPSRHSQVSPVMRTGESSHIRVATSADRSTVPPSGLSVPPMKHTQQAWPVVPQQPHHPHHHQLHQHDDSTVVTGPISPSSMMQTPTMPHHPAAYSQSKTPVVSVHSQTQQQAGFIPDDNSVQQQQLPPRISATQVTNPQYNNASQSPTVTSTMTSPVSYPRYEYGNYHQTSSIRSNTYEHPTAHHYHPQPGTPTSAGGPYHHPQQQAHHPQHQDGYRPVNQSRTPSPTRQASIAGPSSQHDPASMTAQFSYHPQHQPVHSSLDESGIQQDRYYDARRANIESGYHRQEPQQQSPSYAHNPSHHHVPSVPSWDNPAQAIHQSSSMMGPYMANPRQGLEDVHGGPQAGPRTIYMPLSGSSNAQSHPHSAGSDESPRWQEPHVNHPHHPHEAHQTYNTYGYDTTSYQQSTLPIQESTTPVMQASSAVGWSMPSQQNSITPAPASVVAIDSPILTSPDVDSSKAGINLGGVGGDSVDMIITARNVAPSQRSDKPPSTPSSSSSQKGKSTKVVKIQRKGSPASPAHRAATLAAVHQAAAQEKKVQKHKSRKTWTEAEWKKLVDLANLSKMHTSNGDIDWDFVTAGFEGRRCRQGILTVAAKRGLKVSTREARSQKRGRSSDGSDS